MEPIIATTGLIASLRVDANQNENKVKNSALVFVTIPEIVFCHHPGIKDFEIDGKPVKSLGYFDGEDETTANFVSENTIFARNITEEPVEIRTGPRAKKWMLKQVEVTPALRKLGNSQDLRMVALQGKTFKTTPKVGKAFKSIVFEPTNIDTMMFAENSAKVIANVVPNLEAKTYHEFTEVPLGTK